MEPDFDALDAFLAASPAARAAQAARDRRRDRTAKKRLNEYRHQAERQQRQLVQNAVRNITKQMQENQEQFKLTIDTLFGRLTHERAALEPGYARRVRVQGGDAETKRQALQRYFQMSRASYLGRVAVCLELLIREFVSVVEVR